MRIETRRSVDAWMKLRGFDRRVIRRSPIVGELEETTAALARLPFRNLNHLFVRTFTAAAPRMRENTLLFSSIGKYLRCFSESLYMNRST